MKTKAAGQIWGAALAMSPTCLIDTFRDWVEGLSITMVPAQFDGLACIEARTQAPRER
jgi:hypothetical protein